MTGRADTTQIMENEMNYLRFLLLPLSSSMSTSPDPAPLPLPTATFFEGDERGVTTKLAGPSKNSASSER